MLTLGPIIGDTMQMKFFRFEEAWAKEVKAVRKSFLRPSKMVHRKPNDQVCQKD